MAVQVGDTVVRKPVTFSRNDEDQKKHTQAAMRGKVVYVHPLGRFHTVEFMTGGGAIRESFQGGRTMNKQYELCGACAEQMKEGYALKKISGGVDNKVTCSNCGRRRYGATYELAPKEGKKK